VSGRVWEAVEIRTRKSKIAKAKEEKKGKRKRKRKTRRSKKRNIMDAKNITKE